MADGASASEIIEVSLDEIWAAAAPLLEAHYQELCTIKDMAVLKPDYERYQAIEAEGRFLALLAKRGDEVLGYSANFLAASLHYQDLKVFQNDVFYVRPDVRGTRIGIRLRRATLDAVRARWGHGLMLWHVKPGTPMQRLLEHEGCAVMDVILSERV